MRLSSSRLPERSSAKFTYSCDWINRTRRAGIVMVPSPMMQPSALELGPVTVGTTALSLTDVDRLGPNNGTVDGCNPLLPNIPSGQLSNLLLIQSNTNHKSIALVDKFAKQSVTNFHADIDAKDVRTAIINLKKRCE